MIFQEHQAVLNHLIYNVIKLIVKYLMIKILRNYKKKILKKNLLDIVDRYLYSKTKIFVLK